MHYTCPCTHCPFIANVLALHCIEKSQVFRIEERFLSPANSPAKTAMAAAPAPQHNIPHTSPAHKDSAMTTNTRIYNTTNSITSPPSLPMGVPSPTPSGQQQFIGQAQQPQAVVVHNVPTYVQQQSPMPLMMPQVSQTLYY
jgi:hypothetical protein